LGTLSLHPSLFYTSCVPWKPLLALLRINTEQSTSNQLEYALQIFRPSATSKQHGGILICRRQKSMFDTGQKSKCILPQAIG
jgi:hypothetical protein